jgi:YidC/Oxa1 family membrane protein insertase
MNRNMIFFVLGSLALILGWQAMIAKYYPPVAPAADGSSASGANAVSGTASAQTEPAGSQAAAGSTVPAGTTHASLKAAPEQVVHISTKAYEASLSTWGARFNSLKLTGIKSKKNELETMDLVPDQDLPRYATIQLPGVDLAGLSWALLTKNAVMEDGRPTVRFGARVPGQPIELVKTFQFDPEKPQFDIKLSIKNASAQLINLAPLSLQWGPNVGGDTNDVRQFPPAGVVQLEGHVEREKANNDQNTNTFDAPRWVALKSHYFVVGFFPGSAAWNKAELRRQGLGKIETALIAEGISLAPGKSQDLDVQVYAGPLDYRQLVAFGKNFSAVVQFQVYSWFEFLNPLCVLLLSIMRWFHAVTGNWGVAIILLTLLVRGVMFYPSMKSMVSMRKMQTKMAAMQPRLDTLKKMYKDDAQKLNAEMMKLYKEYGVNPLGGCLPMLLQIPIFFALYGTLSAAYELRGASFMWKWTDLTAGDPTFIFPLAMGLSMFAQQKLAPTNSSTVTEEQAQMQKMMLFMMPIMFTGMAIYLHWPMGLLLYWTASNSFGVIQQLSVNRAIK